MGEILEAYKYFLDNSKKIVYSDWWEDVQYIDETYLSRINDIGKGLLRYNFTVGYNDISIHMDDRWNKKINQPFDKINISKKAIEDDARLCSQIMKRTSPRFINNDNLFLLDEDILATVKLTADGVDFFSNYNDLILTFYATRISELSKLGETENYVEIGGGYGGLVGKLKRLNVFERYFLIDTPENLIVQFSYLKDKFGLNNVTTIDSYLESNAQFIFCPIDKCDMLPKVDWFFNSRSFQEMTAEAISFYFNMMQNKIKAGGILMHINGLIKPTRNKVSSIAIVDYPYDDRWDLIYMGHALTQSHMREIVTVRTEQDRSFKSKIAFLY